MGLSLSLFYAPKSRAGIVLYGGFAYFVNFCLYPWNKIYQGFEVCVRSCRTISNWIYVWCFRISRRFWPKADTDDSLNEDHEMVPVPAPRRGKYIDKSDFIREWFQNGDFAPVISRSYTQNVYKGNFVLRWVEYDDFVPVTSHEITHERKMLVKWFDSGEMRPVQIPHQDDPANKELFIFQWLDRHFD